MQQEPAHFDGATRAKESSFRSVPKRRVLRILEQNVALGIIMRHDGVEAPIEPIRVLGRRIKLHDLHRQQRDHHDVGELAGWRAVAGAPEEAGIPDPLADLVEQCHTLAAAFGIASGSGIFE